MRRFLDGLCAVAGIVVASVAVAGGSAAAANSAWTNVHKTQAETPPPALSVACLGGVLSEGPTGDYLTVADYPAFAALTAGLRRIFICGDSIPSFLPSSERAGFASRRH
jgi:hypothetical protein